MTHLAALAGAGLNTLHLLPAFDFSTVDDIKADWQTPACDLRALSAADPAGTAQQDCVGAVAAHDGFNWGYDPWHYSVPEGSYASDPDGPGRTLEFREMVAALAGIGLRVVLDVVYNHTVASGPTPIPCWTGSFPATTTGCRRRSAGDSTCCPNTAAEHAMMQKLIVDSVVLWARQYRVGGFRFDLMGHHPRSTMLAVRSALDALTVADDGVDGPRCTCTARDGTSARSPTMPDSSRPPRRRWRAPASAPSTTGCGTPSAVGAVRRGPARPGIRHRFVHRPERPARRGRRSPNATTLLATG